MRLGLWCTAVINAFCNLYFKGKFNQCIYQYGVYKYVEINNECFLYIKLYYMIHIYIDLFLCENNFIFKSNVNALNCKRHATWVNYSSCRSCLIYMIIVHKFIVNVHYIVQHCVVIAKLTLFISNWLTYNVFLLLHYEPDMERL